jgi:RecB family exonuclease
MASLLAELEAGQDVGPTTDPKPLLGLHEDNAT